ncbi:zinc knuckle CX2CX4HX4C containing protein [Tanacetum coccineum]
MSNNTKCTPKGKVKNLLVKINKFIFPFDFVILDMVEDFRMPIILGRPLLATAHAKVDIFRKSISLEVGNEKVIFKMRSSFTTIIFESVHALRSEISIGDDNLMNIDYDISLYDYEANRLLGIDPNVFTYDIDKVYKITNQGKSCEMETKEETSMEPLIGETYIKIRVIGIDEMPRTRDNVAAIRAVLMKQMAEDRSGQGET